VTTAWTDCDKVAMVELRESQSQHMNRLSACGGRESALPDARATIGGASQFRGGVSVGMSEQMASIELIALDCSWKWRVTSTRMLVPSTTSSELSRRRDKPRPGVPPLAPVPRKRSFTVVRVARLRSPGRAAPPRECFCPSPRALQAPRAGRKTHARRGIRQCAGVRHPNRSTRAATWPSGAARRSPAAGGRRRAAW
jgi:hypothetical protein